jgi:translation initiation factor IF-1
MPRGDHLEMEGHIEDAMGGGQYKIMVDPMPGGTNYHQQIRARLSGHMKKHHIRVLPGDYVKVEVSPYDLSHGMITYRHKFKPAPTQVVIGVNPNP